MGNQEQDKIVAFDTLFTTNHIQILKILLTYMDASMQKKLAVYIKFLELQYTLSFFKTYSASALPGFYPQNSLNISALCDEILPLCSHTGQEQLKQMKNMLESLESMQEMLQMIQTMKDLFPENDNPFGADPSALFSGLSGMPDISGMDMSQLFEIFQAMQSQQGEGGNENESSNKSSGVDG